MVREGELCGFLAYLSDFKALAFFEAFERFGLRIGERWIDATGDPHRPGPVRPGTSASTRAGSRCRARTAATRVGTASTTTTATTSATGTGTTGG